jgi:hypothetical protein
MRFPYLRCLPRPGLQQTLAARAAAVLLARERGSMRKGNVCYGGCQRPVEMTVRSSNREPGGDRAARRLPYVIRP